MIQAKEVTKSFDGVKAVDHISATMKEGMVFGLVGTNGAGKSTFLRMLCGVIKPDEGQILIDDIPIYEQPMKKTDLFYISDEQYFFANATPNDMMNFYKEVYPNFDKERFLSMMKKFELPLKRKINNFSKGMKKQVSVLLGISSNTKYLFCDETFDGLDPVMRQAVKSIFAGEIEERNMTPIVASHNLRELEDICDHVGLLHRGGILLSKDLEDMKCMIHKVQCVFTKEDHAFEIKKELAVIHHDIRGSLHTYTIRGTELEIIERMKAKEPVFYEVLPLSLEEIFISETEVVGYDIKKLIF